ncbi:MAG: hypothetical protein BGN99_11575 [Alphaproteobacteria bacterium 65-37]|nr:SIS domain-containing protein [Alphaproteobacteria bacterium]OJU40750.1 MAG: hypothetical protein BGN99_11575 [Alphaproteobacteria bacterium 65-37]
MPIPAFIREQPQALDACLTAARAFAASPAIDGIALVGSGSSFNAITVARPRFVAARRGPVTLHEPEDFIAELADATTRPLVVVLSQSGASTTSIAAAQAALAAGLRTVAITASPQAALGGVGAELLHMPVGEEPVGPKTKGFLGSMAMLLAMAETLGAPASPLISGADLAPLIEAGRETAEALVPSLRQVDQIVVAGRRANYGVALEASLKITEMAGLPTCGLPTEELLHGRLHGLTDRSVAFLLAEGAAELAEARRVEQVMAARGCRIVVVDAAAGLPSPWTVLGLVVPFQWLAVRLAEDRGLVPQTMRHGALSAELAIKTDARP